MSAGETDWRPLAGGDIALSDNQLKRIGYAVVTEAQSKSIACSMLRAIKQLSREQWIKLDKQPLKDICRWLLAGTEGIDAELTERLTAFETALGQAHELRHIVVHVTWGEEPGPERKPMGYDYTRQRLVSAADIDAAVNGCAELKRAANWAAVRVAELVDEGVWPERSDGVQGMGIRTKNRMVRL